MSHPCVSEGLHTIIRNHSHNFLQTTNLKTSPLSVVPKAKTFCATHTPVRKWFLYFFTRKIFIFYGFSRVEQSRKDPKARVAVILFFGRNTITSFSSHVRRENFARTFRISKPISLCIYYIFGRFFYFQYIPRPPYPCIKRKFYCNTKWINIFRKRRTCACRFFLYVILCIKIPMNVIQIFVWKEFFVWIVFCPIGSIIAWLFFSFCNIFLEKNIMLHNFYI